MRSKMLKKLLCSICIMGVLITMMASVSAFAAPNSIRGDVGSTRYGLVSLKAPQYVVSTTTNERLAISATAPQGTTITVYKLNSATGLYNKVYFNGAPVEAVVGPTRLFAGQVILNSGLNKFIIRGEAQDGSATVVRFDVTLLNKDFMSRIKSVIEFNF